MIASNDLSVGAIIGRDQTVLIREDMAGQSHCIGSDFQFIVVGGTQNLRNSGGVVLVSDDENANLSGITDEIIFLNIVSYLA
jgi:hypothetical protein